MPSTDMHAGSCLLPSYLLAVAIQRCPCQALPAQLARLASSTLTCMSAPPYCRYLLEAAIQRRFPKGLKVHVQSLDHNCFATLTTAFKDAGLWITRAKVGRLGLLG